MSIKPAPTSALMLMLAAAFLALAWPAIAPAARLSDVRGTRHNLSASGPGTTKAVSETQVCVFCHTPHGAALGATPLWNREIKNQTYTGYTSSSLDANAIQGSLDQPGGSSKLCLSCHDGTLAIGSVNVLNGLGSATQQGTQSITMTGTGTGGVMPDGAGAATGFTRHLGITLTNDHPVSVSYTSALATRDGELRGVDSSQKWPPGTGDVVGIRSSGYRPLLPLEPTAAGGIGQVQCGTCHDPHIRETDPTKGNQKFLRQNRFQEASPSPAYSQDNDIVCLSCHDRNQTSGIWAYSAHANSQVATQTYKAGPANDREFPANIPVWKVSCLNCHDTHTVQGSRRLLREGTDSPLTPKSGGNAALEETCYQCHRDITGSIVTNTPNAAPNIRDEFARARRMPIRSVDQSAGSEVHDIGGNFSDPGFVDCTTTNNRCGADFIESRANLGSGNVANRHAECTDCHNPHRVVKFRDFRGNPPGSLAGAPDAAATHQHTDTAGYTHTNVISGALRGAWGVEPVYTSASFQNLPLSFIVKRSDPGTSVDISIAASYVTREYQICLKCHSNYGYTDDNLYPSGSTRPSLGGPGLTASPRVNFTRYTNQAKEFQAPVSHKGEVSTTDSGASATFSNSNRRSWHPVMDDTGRTGAIRGNGTDISNNWRLPWRNAVGAQTMYCGDCHGNDAASTTSVIPNAGEPWGPHGSSNDFLLKGTWNTASGSGQANALCFKCHDPNVYAPTGGGGRTGFWIGATSSRGANTDGHLIHSGRDKLNNTRCNWCHIAVPHGWKNKGLLVNLQDVGPEAGQAAGTAIPNGSLPYTSGPYYRNSMLKVKNFRPSGNWVIDACGQTGQDSRDWMRSTCNNPP